MESLPRHSRVLAFAAIAVGAGLALGFAGWPQPDRTLEFSGLILAAILASALVQQSATEDGVTMPPSFVIDFTSLLLFGPHGTMFVAVAASVTRGLSDAERPQWLRRMLANAATVTVAIQA